MARKNEESKKPTAVSDGYYLKIGASDIFDEGILADLSLDDEEKKKKARSYLSERLKETRVRIGTLLKTDNVSFLIGAGASTDAGGVGLASIPLELEKSLHERAGETARGKDPDWLVLFYNICSLLSDQPFDISKRKSVLAGASTPGNIPLNLEDYLSHLYMWRASMGEIATRITFDLRKGGSVTVSSNDIDSLILEIKRVLVSLVELPVSGKEASLKYHRRLIQKILTRPLNLRRANLFTLNYDTLIEKAADAEGVMLVDGFVGTLRRVFRPESYDIDFYFPAQTTEGRVHRLDRALHLYKLHGSITWYRCLENWENPYGICAAHHKQGTIEDDVLIYPSPLKYGQALGLPYSELFRHFGSVIAQPQSVLFTIGYGYGDVHVNSLIHQALAIPSFVLVIVDPKPTNDFVKRLRELDDERIWLVTGSELGSFQHFVDKLLPDLREEEITLKVAKTYKALSSTVHDEDEDAEGSNDGK